MGGEGLGTWEERVWAHGRRGAGHMGGEGLDRWVWAHGEERGWARGEERGWAHGEERGWARYMGGEGLGTWGEEGLAHGGGEGLGTWGRRGSGHMGGEGLGTWEERGWTQGRRGSGHMGRRGWARGEERGWVCGTEEVPGTAALWLPNNSPVHILEAALLLGTGVSAEEHHHGVGLGRDEPQQEHVAAATVVALQNGLPKGAIFVQSDLLAL